MIRKMLLCASVALPAMLSSNAMAQGYGTAGCGLGSSVVGGGDGFGQVFAFTTNHTGFYIINFQMTSIIMEMANCNASGVAEAQARQEQYMLSNMSQIEKDMAKGGGESLEGLSELMGCEASAQQEFASTSQKSYSAVFAKPGAVAALNEMKSHLRQNEVLNSSCKFLAQK